MMPCLRITTRMYTTVVDFRELIWYNTPMRTLRSRYGDERTVTSNGHGVYTIEGKAHYYRVGMTDDNSQIAYFDPEGGAFIAVGSDYGFGKITSIIVESCAPKDHFKIRVEVEDDLFADANQNNEMFRNNRLK